MIDSYERWEDKLVLELQKMGYVRNCRRIMNEFGFKRYKQMYEDGKSPKSVAKEIVEECEEWIICESTNISAAKKLLSENGFYVFKKAKKMDEAFSAMESDDKDMKYYIKELDTLVNYHNKNLQKGQYYFLCDFLDFLKDSYIYESTKLNEKSLNQYNDVIEAVDDFKGRNFAEVEQFLYDNGCECIERDLITNDGQKAYDEIWLIASADGDKQWDVRIIYNAKDKIINFVETWELT